MHQGKAIVKMQDMRRLGYCSGGIRNFFAKWGLDYSAFLKEGVIEDALLATGDDMAIAAVKEARRGDQQ